MAAKLEMDKKSHTPSPGVILVAMVVAIMIGGVWISTNSLKTKLEYYHGREEILREEIAKEETRAEEIEEYSKYVQTNAYVEQMAKEKCGLVFEDEIIFKKED